MILTSTYTTLLHAGAALIVAPESPSELFELERRDLRGEALTHEKKVPLPLRRCSIIFH
jgi:ubiquinone biosynthesis protein COQ9